MIGLDFHGKSFVRSLLIKNFHETVEAGLLLKRVGGRRLAGFFLQGDVHAFVTAVSAADAPDECADADAKAFEPNVAKQT